MSQSPKPPRTHELDPAPLLQFDPDEYLEYIADFDLTPEQQEEYLRTLWSIVTMFVDIGFAQDVTTTARRENYPEIGDLIDLIEWDTEPLDMLCSGHQEVDNTYTDGEEA